MGDPASGARRLREALRPGGSALIVEPAGSDRPEENHHLLGRLFYAASTAICTPGSLAQEGRLGLGNQAGPTRVRKILAEAGFSSVRDRRYHPDDQRRPAMFGRPPSRLMRARDYVSKPILQENQMRRLRPPRDSQLSVSYPRHPTAEIST
jgi:hypothetical protein